MKTATEMTQKQQPVPDALRELHAAAAPLRQAVLAFVRSTMGECIYDTAA